MHYGSEGGHCARHVPGFSQRMLAMNYVDATSTSSVAQQEGKYNDERQRANIELFSFCFSLSPRR